MLLAMTRKEGKKQQTDPRDEDKKEKQQANVSRRENTLGL